MAATQLQAAQAASVLAELAATAA
jgi:hypothetical protein